MKHRLNFGGLILWCCWLTTTMLTTRPANCMEPELDIESDIVVNNASISAGNLSNSFYEVDYINSTINPIPPTTTIVPTFIELNSINNITSLDETSTVPDSNIDFLRLTNSNTSRRPAATRLEVSLFTIKPLSSTVRPATALSTSINTITTTTRATTSTTTSSPETVTIMFGSSTPTTVSTFNSGSYAELRLRSNRVTVKPVVVTQPTMLRKKSDDVTTIPMNGITNDGLIITAPTEDDENRIWKIVLHGTNMNDEELRMCNKTLIEAHLKPYSRRKVARYLKKELDKKFEQWNYRFSIILSSTSRNTMGKALHGIWMSVSLDGVHYFVTATYKVVQGPKLNEEQMNKIEYWCLLHTIGSRNMTGYRKYNRISQKIKSDLDREYGNGNVWSVIIVKNRFFVKAKVLEDVTNHVEFSRLNSGHYIVFRGGQDIPESKTRHSRLMNIFDSSFSSEDESGDEINFFR